MQTKNIKRILICIILILTFLQMTSFAKTQYFYDGAYHDYTAQPISLYVNGTKVEGDMPPILLNDRTMVPAIYVFSQLGAKVEWIDKTKQVKISYNNTNLLLTINSRDVLMNGKTVSINPADPPAKIVNDRTMIPARFVAEQLGFLVSWDGTKRIVSISSDLSPTPTVKPVTLTGSITGVTIDGTKVTIKGKKLPKPSVSTLKEPNRIVIDFQDTALPNGGKTSTNTGEKITALRYAFHETYTRVVLEVVDGYSYQVTGDSNSYQITVSAPNVSSTTAPTKAPTATPEPSATPKPPHKPNAGGPIVIIDPGHGGKDPGAVGYDDDGKIALQEKDANLAIAKKVSAMLKSKGVNVYMTMYTDQYVTLQERSDYANSMNADLFVSIHNNSIANSPDTNGFMVMYDQNSKEVPAGYFTYSTQLGQYIRDAIAANTDLKNLGLRNGAELWVIRKTDMPAVLVECGFVTNEGDRTKISNDAYQSKIATGIVQGIMKALSQAK